MYRQPVKKNPVPAIKKNSIALRQPEYNGCIIKDTKERICVTGNNCKGDAHSSFAYVEKTGSPV